MYAICINKETCSKKASKVFSCSWINLRPHEKIMSQQGSRLFFAFLWQSQSFIFYRVQEMEHIGFRFQHKLVLISLKFEARHLKNKVTRPIIALVLLGLNTLQFQEESFDILSCQSFALSFVFVAILVYNLLFSTESRRLSILV